MFQPGELVVYGTTGVCRVESITRPNLTGADRNKSYYLLKPLQQDGVIYTPVENPKVSIRSLISREEAEGTAVALNNRSYTAYMLQVAYEGGAAEIAAAILSCALSYEAIARRIVAQRPEVADHPFYGEWVRGYADEEYHRANQALVELTERLAAGYSPEGIARLSGIFAACSRYELAFWDMAWEMRK